MHDEQHERNAAPQAGTDDARVSGLPCFLWRLFWQLMPVLLFVGGYVSVTMTQDRVGYVWDESYYYEPAMAAADWLIGALRGGDVFSREAIDAHWAERSEHPSIQKLLSGLAIRLFDDPSDHLIAMRLPMAAMYGLALAFVFLLGRRASDRGAGLVAALVFWSLPRVFGHAHFATMEPPLIFMTLLVVYCYLRGLESPRWAVATGLAMGALLATKINGFFLPIPLVLWSHLFARRRYVNNLFCTLVLAPVTMVALWPWLWPDPAARLLAYLQFHAQHQQTAVYFLGETWGYGRPNAPRFYPLAMIVATVPPVSLLLIVAGVVAALRRVVRRPVTTLFLMIAAIQLAVACAPGVPRYDGVRLFLPVFPFLALLAGAVAADAVRGVRRLATRPGSPAWHAHLARAIGPLMASAVVINGAWAIGSAHPWYLSSFNSLVGGTAGAERRGFEITYWHDALNRDVIDRLNTLPDGASIRPLAMHELNLLHFQRWGLLRGDLRIGGDPPYDYHLLQMRRGFFTRPERALADGGRYRPIATWGPEGTPLLALYATGEAFESYWPTRWR